MKSQVYVGIALVIAILLIMNIIVIGIYFPDIFNKNSNRSNLKTIENSTLIIKREENLSQNISNETVVMIPNNQSSTTGNNTAKNITSNSTSKNLTSSSTSTTISTNSSSTTSNTQRTTRAS